MREKTAPGCIVPLVNAPPFAVTVCVMLEVLVHTTVSPTETFICDGAKLAAPIETFTCAADVVLGANAKTHAINNSVPIAPMRREILIRTLLHALKATQPRIPISVRPLGLEPRTPEE